MSELGKLRWMAAQLADVQYAAVASAAREMMALIDREIASGQDAAVEHKAWRESMDSATIPTQTLLEEIGRRMREVRYVRKLCTACGEREARARGLCLTCYCRKRKNGELGKFCKSSVRKTLRPQQ